MTFTYTELGKCAAREAALRKNVYAKRGIGPKEEHEIAMMEAISEHFKNLAKFFQGAVGPMTDHPLEPLWQVFPREGGFIIGYKTNARFSDEGVMTIGQTGGTPLYAFPDEKVVYPTEAEARAAIDKLEKSGEPEA